MFRLFSLFFSLTFLVACGSDRESDGQWQHSIKSSYSAAFSPNGKYVLVGDTDSSARLWHIEKNKLIYSWKNRDEAGTTTVVGFSADGKVAATAEQDLVILWEVATGEPMVRLTFPVKIKALALSRRGDYLLLALHDRTAIYFDVIGNRVLQVLEHDGANVGSSINQPINAVAISPSGKYALTGADDHTARLWRLKTGKQLRSWKHKNVVNIVSFYPKGAYVFTGAENGQAHFWDIKTGKKKYTLRLSSLWPDNLPLPDFPTSYTTVFAINYSLNGKYLVTGHSSQMLCQWQVETGEKVDCWTATEKKGVLKPGVVLQAVGFSPNNKAIYSESSRGIGQKWKLK